MKKAILFKSVVMMFVLVVGMVPSFALAANIYDLTADWSKTDNPNGQWAVYKGTTLLPHQVGTGNPMTYGLDFFAMGKVGGNFLPAWWQGQGSDNDIYTHSWDSANGGSYGESILTWTSPVAGKIDVSGSIWYDQPGLYRSNNFFLYLGATLLATGVVSETSHNGKANAITFYDALVSGQSLTNLSVNTGDVIKLEIIKSAGQTWGTVSGVTLNISETPSAVPLPGAVWLLGSGLLGLIGLKRKAKK